MTESKLSVLKRIGKALDPRPDMRLVYPICKCGCPQHDHVIDFFSQGFDQCKRCDCRNYTPDKELSLIQYINYLSSHYREWQTKLKDGRT